MKATEANWKDIKKYYEGTYILVPEYDEHQAVYVDMAGPDGIKVCTIDHEKGFIETPYNIHNPLTIRRKWFQGEQGTLIQRIPARMWRKGISQENTLFRTINGGGLIVNNSTSFQKVNEFFGAKPYIENLTKDCPPVSALNEMWAVRISAGGPLFLYQYNVGKISLSKKMVHILKELKYIKLPKAFDEWKVVYV